jgi:hypothetical protein
VIWVAPQRGDWGSEPPDPGSAPTKKIATYKYRSFADSPITITQQRSFADSLITITQQRSLFSSTKPNPMHHRQQRPHLFPPIDRQIART